MTTTTTHKTSFLIPLSPPPSRPPPRPPSSKRTNCGKRLYRFGYGKDAITLTRPCFEPHCNTCTQRQPAVGIYDSDSGSAFVSPRTTPAQLTDDELRRRKEACYRGVEEQLRRLSQLHVRNATPVKMRTKGTRKGVQSGRVEKKMKVKMARDGMSSPPPPQQRKTNSRTLLEDLERSERQSRTQQLVVLKFENLEKFAKLSKGLEDRKAAVPEEGKKLFLIIGKGDTLRCVWK